MILVLLALFGCPKEGSSPSESAKRSAVAAAPARSAPATAEVERARVGAGEWQDAATGLRLVVPPGWTALAGLEGADERLFLRHGETQASLRVYTGARLSAMSAMSGVSGASDADDGSCTVRFEDGEGHRSLPGLGHVGTATCVPNDPDGDTVLVWFGETGGLGVRVELRCPAGGVVAGRLAAEPVLRSVSGR